MGSHHLLSPSVITSLPISLPFSLPIYPNHTLTIDLEPGIGGYLCWNATRNIPNPDVSAIQGNATYTQNLG